MNYRPRIVGGAFLVLMVLFGSPTEVMQSPAIWVYLGLGLAWPHIAFLLARRATDSRQAERRNVLGDSFCFGANPTLLGFQLWPSAAIMVIALINSLMFGGVRFLITSLVPMVMGGIAAIVVFGPRLQLDSTPAVIALSVAAIAFYVGLIGMTAYQLRVRQRETRQALEREEGKSQALLENVFPRPVIPRLRQGESPIADQFADVTVIFIDIVEFTPLAEKLGPKGTVILLNDLFLRFDQSAREAGVEKIETTGDGYLAVAGAPKPLDDHPAAAARFALGVIEAVRATASGPHPVNVRVGIHTGPIYGGVVGESRFHYKIFGETVNIASRIQSAAAPDRVLVSEASYKRLAGRFRFEERGTVQLKGHGPERTYWLLGAA